MVKSKELKRLRKQIAQAERLVPNPLAIVQQHLPITAFQAVAYDGSQLPPDLLSTCLDLYTTNMQEYHCRPREEKHDEFTHRTARFLVVNNNNTLAAYLHYRFCTDDDDDPTRTVLYVYELQVACKRQGLGRALLTTAFAVCRQAQLRHVLLTVQRHNAPALALYRSLGMQVDVTSPSQCGDTSVDYEIMCKTLTE